jgi:hypothetical protein
MCNKGSVAAGGMARQKNVAGGGVTNPKLPRRHFFVQPNQGQIVLELAEPVP